MALAMAQEPESVAGMPRARRCSLRHWCENPVHLVSKNTLLATWLVRHEMSNFYIEILCYMQRSKLMRLMQ